MSKKQKWLLSKKEIEGLGLKITDEGKDTRISLIYDNPAKRIEVWESRTIMSRRLSGYTLKIIDKKIGDKNRIYLEAINTKADFIAVLILIKSLAQYMEGYYD